MSAPSSDPRPEPALRLREEAEAALREGRAGAAEVLYGRALRCGAADSQTWNGLGHALHAQGRHLEAVRAYRRALRREPARTATLFNLAVLLHERRRLAAADGLLRRALDAEPGDAEAWSLLGAVRESSGRRREALRCLARAAALRPGDAALRLGIARAWLDLGDAVRALAIAEEALAIRPRDAAGMELRTRALVALGREEHAMAAARAERRAAPSSTSVLLNESDTLRRVGDLPGAVAAAEEALVADPSCVRAATLLARAHGDAGDLARARAALHRALAIDSGDAQAFLDLAQCCDADQHDRAALAAQEARLASGAVPDGDRALIHFALGKAYDDLDEPDRAFPHFVQANALRRRDAPRFDRGAFERLVDGLIRVFDEPIPKGDDATSDGSGRVVLVVGMPRSGTTLVERILAAHPQVRSVGESRALRRAVQGLAAPGAAPYPEVLREVRPAAFRAAGRRYLAKVLRGDAGGARVVDKMPGNSLHLGAAARMLPRARVVHCRRDPVDTGLSIFMQDLEAAHAYAFDLEDIAAYQLGHARLMRHWERVLPRATVTVNYEDVVAAPEQRMRALVDELGLPWDDACLEFHRGTGPVTTISRWQVRRPVYRRSAGRWLRYRRHVQPLVHALGLTGARHDGEAPGT